MRVGRLRGAVNAADAAIATIATDCLSIFEKDESCRNLLLQQHDSYTTVLGWCPAKLCELIVRVQSDRS